MKKGVDLSSQSEAEIEEALNAVRQSDYVVLCIGISTNQEGETKDR